MSVQSPKPTDWSVKPVRLHIRNIGPFRGEEPYILEFNGPRSTSDATSTMRPRADIFMIVGENGCGKTTILDCIAGLFDQLNEKPTSNFAERLRPGSSAMIDLLIRYKEGNRRRSMMLHLWIGERPRRSGATTEEPTPYDHHKAAFLGFTARSDARLSPSTCSLGLLFLDGVRRHAGSSLSMGKPDAIEAPTVLQFKPGWVSPGLGRSQPMPPDYLAYRPLQVFSGSGDRYRAPLSDFLHWYSLEEPRKYAKILGRLSNRVFGQFEETKRLRPIPFERNSWDGRAAIVDPENRPLPKAGTDRQTRLRYLQELEERGHTLAELGSGEQMLLQLYAWLEICATRSTIVLIDEIDAHLGRKRADDLVAALEGIALGSGTTTIFFTTHDRTLIDNFLKGATEEKRRGGVHIGLEDAA